MGKAAQVLKLVRKINVGRMFDTAREISQQTGKNRLAVLTDSVWCGMKYSAGYMDYKVFAFYNLNGKQRATFVTRGYNNELIRRLNDKAYWDDFMDKVKFNRRFDRQLRRDWLEFAGSTPEDLGRFCEGKEWIMSKPLDACCGKGIEKLRPADFESMEALHEYLQQAGCGLVEEVVVQHPDIAAIYPNAVNTIRMATILTGDKATVVYAFIRIGNKGHVVDNLNSGGMAAPLDVETGKIKYPAADKDGIVYDRHPQTDTPITGAVIPFWKEAVALCEECAKVIPQVRYVGWDIAITEKGPVVIEGNQFPGHDILQLPVHCPDKIGMLPVIKKALGEA